MDEVIKLLDKDLEYLEHEVTEDALIIHVKSTDSEVICPLCGSASSKAHSRYERSFQDLPVGGKKAKVVILSRKMFCHNPECQRKTFAERFEFLPPRAKKSERLTEEILRVSSEVSSITASWLLNNGVATVCKSTICTLLKKRKSLSSIRRKSPKYASTILRSRNGIPTGQ